MNGVIDEASVLWHSPTPRGLHSISGIVSGWTALLVNYNDLQVRVEAFEMWSNAPWRLADRPVTVALDELFRLD